MLFRQNSLNGLKLRFLLFIQMHLYSRLPDINPKRRKNPASLETGSFDMVAGTGFVADERTNSTVTSQWIYLGVCHGVKRLKRVGFSIYSLN